MNQRKHVSPLVSILLTLSLALALVLVTLLGLRRPPVVRAGSYTVTTLDPSGPGSLRRAILDANAGPGPHVISFQPGLSGTIVLTGDLPGIGEALTLHGPGPEVLAVSGANAHRPFYIHPGTPVTITGLTVRDGWASDGGGIQSQGTLVLSDVVVISNTAWSGHGGGLSVYGTQVTLNNVDILSNTALQDGGGVYIANGYATLTGTQFVRNAANRGGGVYFSASGLALTNTQFLYNTAAVTGSAILDAGTFTVTLAHSCVVGNTDVSIVRDNPSLYAMDARGNWWGAPDGPSGVGPGHGDAVGAKVIYTGFLSSPILGCPSLFSDLVITKTAHPDPAIAGTSLVYTLTVANHGGMTADDVVLSDTLPPSLTLHTLDQTDDNWGTFRFPDGDHQNTVWDPGRSSTTADDWLRLADPATATGIYTSSVLDAFNQVSWELLRWVPRRPYGKPLPDDNQAETAYALGNANMTGTLVLLHLDEAGPPFANTSGFGYDALCPAGPGESCPTPAAPGRFGDALQFDASLSQTVVVTAPLDSERFAVELWVRPDAVTDTSFILRSDGTTGTLDAGHFSHLLGVQDGKFFHAVDDGALRTVAGTTAVQTDTWYHLVGTAQSGGDMALYVNGVREGQRGGLNALWAGGDRYRLGAAYGTTRTASAGTYFSGRLDEVAVYSRTLSAAEVVDHYLRGALRLRMEARSCAQPDCAAAPWEGPYTEAGNATLGLPETALSLPDNRYFQYRATLETGDAAYSPELHSVTVLPPHRAVTATQGSCWATQRTFTCALGSLAPDQVVTVSAGASIHPSALGVITNTATVTTPQDLTLSTVALTTTVDAVADLVIRKHDEEEDWDGDLDSGWDVGGADPVNPGSPLTYTLRVRNGGPSTARAITVTDQLPPGVIGYASGDPGWVCGPPGNTITCTLRHLLPTYGHQGAYAWQHIVVTATAPLTEGVITNTAWVTSGTAETLTDTLDNTITETTTIMPVADLTIEKRDGPDPVDPGATLRYTVTVTNRGPYTQVTGVVVTDTLPAGLSGHPVANDDWSCTAPEGLLVCQKMSPFTATTSSSFQITVTAPLSGFLANTVHVTAEQYDPEPENNWATAYTAVRPVADLALGKGDAPDPVNAGAPLTYTLIVTNHGPVAAGTVSTTVEATNSIDLRVPVRDGRAAPYRSTIFLNSVPGVVRDVRVTLHDFSHSYPSDLSLLLVGPDEQAVVLMANAGGGTGVEDLTLTFHDAGVPVGEPLTSTTVYHPTNNGYSVDFESPAPAGPYAGGMSTFVGGDPNGHWRLYAYDNVFSDGGSIGGWSLQVTAGTTDTVTLSDTLPAGLTGLTVAAPDGWSCATGANPLLCEAERLPVGVPTAFTLTASAPITAGVITNTARVASTIADLGPHPNEATVTTTVRAVVDLALDKTAHAGTVPVGAPLTYTVRITNHGPSPLPPSTVLTVTDVLPEGVSDGSAAGDGWRCDASTSPTLTCVLTAPVVPIPPLLITATAPSTPGEIVNEAIVTATTQDPVMANNTGRFTVTVGELPILGLTATNDSPQVTSKPVQFSAAITQGSNVTYRWSFGDGFTGTGQSVSHSYAVSNTYTAIVTASNSLGQVWTTTQVIVIDPYRVHLPLAMHRYVTAPDLVVTGILAASDGVTVVIKNEGSAPAVTHFWVDLYVDPDPPPNGVNQTWDDGRCEHGALWGVPAGDVPLEPGETLTLTIGDAYYWPEASHISATLPAGTELWAQVDSANTATPYGSVEEGHEILGLPYENNILGPVLVEAGAPAVLPAPSGADRRRLAPAEMPVRP